MFSVHPTPGEFHPENVSNVFRPPYPGGVFTLKTRQMFSVPPTPGESHPENASNVFSPHYAGGIEKHNNHWSVWICVWRKLGQGNHMIVVTASFSKYCFQHGFGSHENEKSAFSNSSGLKSVFEKLRFRDGLVWTEGLTGQIKLRFQIPPERSIVLTGPHWGSLPRRRS